MTIAAFKESTRLGVLLGAKLSGNDVLPNRAARIGGVISGVGAVAAAVSFAF